MREAERTSDFFDAYAADFSAIYGTSNNFLDRIVNRLFRKSMMIRYRKTIEGCEPVAGKTVIDIGCGPGHYSVALALRGARRVVGVDFAPAMIDLARRNAEVAGVAATCEFLCRDFMELEQPGRFDYAVLMGFMDYIPSPGPVIDRVLGITSSRAFLSFPAAGGFLAWQRRIRYRQRCDLFLYTETDLRKLLAESAAAGFEIERIERDFFIVLDAAPGKSPGGGDPGGPAERETGNNHPSCQTDCNSTE
jgi:SAM-dependent methyltransferase